MLKNCSRPFVPEVAVFFVRKNYFPQEERTFSPEKDEDPPQGPLHSYMIEKHCSPRPGVAYRNKKRVFCKTSIDWDPRFREALLRPGTPVQFQIYWPGYLAHKRENFPPMKNMAADCLCGIKKCPLHRRARTLCIQPWSSTSRFVGGGRRVVLVKGGGLTRKSPS